MHTLHSVVLLLTALQREEKRWCIMTCRASALELLLSAVQLGSFPLQLLLLPQQIGLSCSSSRLKKKKKKESQKHFTRQTHLMRRNLSCWHKCRETHQQLSGVSHYTQMDEIQQDFTQCTETMIHYKHHYILRKALQIISEAACRHHQPFCVYKAIHVLLKGHDTVCKTEIHIHDPHIWCLTWQKKEGHSWSVVLHKYV